MNTDAPHFSVHIHPDNLVPEPQTAQCPHCREPLPIAFGHFVPHVVHGPRWFDGVGTCPGSGTAPFSDKLP